MKYLFLITLIFSTTQSLASELKIEPVYGVERTQREFPAPPKYKTTTFVGIRALYGTPGISGEFELNQSLRKEDFPDDNLEVTYDTKKALLGVRSYLLHSKLIGLYFRFGARAEQKQRTILENDVERTEKDPISLDPYAGTGLTIVAGKLFALNAGATLIHNKNATESSEKYDTRYTFSFTIKAGSK